MMRRIFFPMAVLALASIAPGAESKFIAGFSPRPAGSITFNKDIAPIIYANCAGCHRPGQVAPFVLLDYADVQKRAQLVAELVGKRAMPPWQPEPGYGEFEGERRLTTNQIGLIQQWVAEGAVEGNPAELPPKPVWVDGWELGKPDLILRPAQSYTLAADGRDVYRNFVIPVPITNNFYVRALEFHANSRALHHAFMFLDRMKQSRPLEGKDGAPGFGGMDLPSAVAMPQGHLLSWQPGRRAYQPRPEFAWTLPKGADFIVQAHMNPTGKPETIQPEIGLYFTPQPPTRSFYKIGLMSMTIDIPPGQENYVVEDSYKLPVDATVFSVNPHAHYLGKELQGYATLPDGTRKWLLLIKNWDFYWQGDYRLKEPLALPKGTTLAMHYTFDNSDGNPRNPSHPPRRVTSGINTTNEMAEFWIQVSAAPQDMSVLAADFQVKAMTSVLQSYEYRLRLDPNDANAHARYGMTRLIQGSTNDAVAHLEAAVKIDTTLDEPHYYLGLIYRARGQIQAARRELEKTVALNTNAYRAYGTLGFMAAQEQKKDEAIEYFRHALAINPDDALARNSIEQLRKMK